MIQSHVHPENTVSYFYVQWDVEKVDVGRVSEVLTFRCRFVFRDLTFANHSRFLQKLEYPNVNDNRCAGGTELENGACLCDTTVVEKARQSILPSKSDVLELKVGAFDPTTYGAGEYVAITETTNPDSVSAYQKASESEYSAETIFRVMKDGEFAFFKNVVSVVLVCGG